MQPSLQSSFRILFWPLEVPLCPFTVNSCSCRGFLCLITNEVEFLFIYLLAILISSSLKCLLKSFEFFFFFSLIYGSLYIPETNPLKLYMMHIIFSCFVVCLFFLFMISFFCIDISDFNVVQFINFLS